MPAIFIDYEIKFNEITDELINEIESLKPFGPGNREPIFSAINIKALSSKIVANNHRQMFLCQTFGKTGKTFRAIDFNIDPCKPFKEDIDHIIFHVRWNYWNGKKTAQLIIKNP